MGLYDDFRASISPDTAERRLTYFRDRLSGAKHQETEAELAGLPVDYLSSRYAYRHLVEAHVRFAEAQVAEAAKLAAAKEPASLPVGVSIEFETSAGRDEEDVRDSPADERLLRSKCLELAYRDFAGEDGDTLIARADKFWAWVKDGKNA